MKEEETMKRLMGWMLVLALCLGLTGAAGAEEFMLITNYATIVAYYDSAVKAQEESDISSAIEFLEEMVRYYNEMAIPAVKTYNDTQLYYAYAMGRIELSKEAPDYQAAWGYLGNIGDNLYNVAAYRQYAKGMAEMNSKDYAAAIADLRAVRGVLKEFTAKCISALTQCEADYKSSVIDAGKDACKNDKHEKAQELYNQYLGLIEYDTDVKALRDECIGTHGDNPEVEVRLEIVNAVATTQGSMKLTWKGVPEEYQVKWTSDLVHGKDTQSAEVTGHSYTVEGLLPGTVYRFTVVYQGDISAQIDRETRDAAAYPPAEGKDRFWTGSSSLFRFDNSRYDFLASGKASYEFANDKSCKYLLNNTVELFEKPISESCVLFMFTTFGVPEDIDGKEYQLLLHIDGVATLTETGVFGEADDEGVVKVCANGSDIYVLAYDLFDQAVENYSDLAEKTFHLDLLVDGRFVASAEKCSLK